MPYLVAQLLAKNGIVWHEGRGALRALFEAGLAV